MVEFVTSKNLMYRGTGILESVIFSFEFRSVENCVKSKRRLYGIPHIKGFITKEREIENGKEKKSEVVRMMERI